MSDFSLTVDLAQLRAQAAELERQRRELRERASRFGTAAGKIEGVARQLEQDLAKLRATEQRVVGRLRLARQKLARVPLVRRRFR